MDTMSQAAQNAGNALKTGVETLRNAQQPGQTEQRVPTHGDEPMSGIQGKGTINDPYDAGNRDEQLGAPINKDNSAVIPEPLSSTMNNTGAGKGTLNDEYVNPKADVVAANTGSSANTVKAEPATSMTPNTGVAKGVITDEYVNPKADVVAANTRGPAAKSTLKDEPVGIHGSTLKDESMLTHPKPDEPRTIASQPSTAAAATAAKKSAEAGTGTEQRQQSTTESQSQRQQSESQSQSQSQPQSGSQSQSQSQPQSGSQSESQNKDQNKEQSSSTSGSNDSGASTEQVAHDHGVSKEALRGPDCPPPRQSYEKQMKDPKAGGSHEAKEKDDDKEGTSKDSSSKDSGSKDSKSKDGKDEHHHKSIKEKLSDIVHHHH